MRESQIIRKFTVPQTEIVVMIERVIHPAPVGGRARKVTYTITRLPYGATFVNYLSAGRDTFAEARDVANFLWSDAVTRRDAVDE